MVVAIFINNIIRDTKQKLIETLSKFNYEGELDYDKIDFNNLYNTFPLIKRKKEAIEWVKFDTGTTDEVGNKIYADKIVINDIIAALHNGQLTYEVFCRSSQVVDHFIDKLYKLKANNPKLKIVFVSPESKRSRVATLGFLSVNGIIDGVYFLDSNKPKELSRSNIKYDYLITDNQKYFKLKNVVQYKTNHNSDIILDKVVNNHDEIIEFIESLNN